MVEVKWPERPTCHGDAPRFASSLIGWREPRIENSPHGYAHDQPYRSCSYCGSIHPEDLLRHLNAGARLGGSDWKYGWPHKFYVEGIPTGLAIGSEYVYGSSSELVNGKRVETFIKGIVTPNKSVHAKWYNEHLHDLSPESFVLVAAALEKHAHIRFQLVDGKLKYSAPYGGYQA